MQQAKAGDTVRIHYTGTLQDGSVFDSSRGREPLQFTLGSGQVIEGFDQGVTGMQPGEEKTVTIPAAKAYGPRHEEMIFRVGADQFPEDLTPEVGQKLQMSDGQQVMMVTVTGVDPEGVTLDANHPLAGQDLTFALELVEIV
jgi:peptidylprolyl isomerase